MASGWRNRLDPMAAIASLIALVMTVLYVAMMSQQGDVVVGWFIGGLTMAALLGIYGAVRAVPLRRLALAVSGAVLTALGVVAILSIGLPILGAGVLALAAAARFRSGDRS
jgi:hypothetical protein